VQAHAGDPHVESHETVGAFLHAELATAAAHSKPVGGQRPEGLAWFTARQRRSSARARCEVEAALRRLHLPLHVDWATPDKLFVVDFLVVRLHMITLRLRFQHPKTVSASPCSGCHRLPHVSWTRSLTHGGC